MRKASRRFRLPFKTHSSLSNPKSRRKCPQRLQRQVGLRLCPVQVCPVGRVGGRLPLLNQTESLLSTVDLSCDIERGNGVLLRGRMEQTREGARRHGEDGVQAEHHHARGEPGQLARLERHLPVNACSSGARHESSTKLMGQQEACEGRSTLPKKQTASSLERPTPREANSLALANSHRKQQVANKWSQR